jgi:uncharacterized protein YijF (DUF1287 family)
VTTAIKLSWKQYMTLRVMSNQWAIVRFDCSLAHRRLTNLEWYSIDKQQPITILKAPRQRTLEVLEREDLVKRIRLAGCFTGHFELTPEGQARASQPFK